MDDGLSDDDFFHVIGMMARRGLITTSNRSGMDIDPADFLDALEDSNLQRADSLSTKYNRSNRMSEMKKRYADNCTLVYPGKRIMTEPRRTEFGVTACIAINGNAKDGTDSFLAQFVAKGKQADWLEEAGKGAICHLTFQGPGLSRVVKGDKVYYQLDYLVGLQVVKGDSRPEPKEDPPEDDLPPPTKKRFGSKAI